MFYFFQLRVAARSFARIKISLRVANEKIEWKETLHKIIGYRTRKDYAVDGSVPSPIESQRGERCSGEINEGERTRGWEQSREKRETGWDSFKVSTVYIWDFSSLWRKIIEVSDEMNRRWKGIGKSVGKKEMAGSGKRLKKNAQKGIP